MNDILGKNWQKTCPAYLTKGEKADIASALLRALSAGRLSLYHYLQGLKMIKDYPEAVWKVPQLKKPLHRQSCHNGSFEITGTNDWF